MNRYEKQIIALRRKLRAHRNGGGRCHRELGRQIKKLDQLWKAEQVARLAAIEAQMDAERKKRMQELGAIIAADAKRDYEAALAAIGSRPE